MAPWSLPRAEAAPGVLRGLLWAAHRRKEKVSRTKPVLTEASSPYVKPFHPRSMEVAVTRETKLESPSF